MQQGGGGRIRVVIYDLTGSHLVGLVGLSF